MSLLYVLVGSSPFADNDRIPLLVVEAEAERIEDLRQQRAGGSTLQDVSLHQAVLASRSGLEIHWYRYSDPRFNGVVPLDRWKEFYPNLVLLQEERLSSQSLADLLAQWPATTEGSDDISLILRQGDPLEILKGVDTWLHRIRRIELDGPKVDELWGDGCARWLEEQGFNRDQESPCTWLLTDQGLRLLKQRDEIASLQEKVSSLLQGRQLELEERQERLNKSCQVLSLIFPYSIYRKRHPQLADLSDPDLIAHVITSGLEEGLHLDEASLGAEMRQGNADTSTSVLWSGSPTSTTTLARTATEGLSDAGTTAWSDQYTSALNFCPITDTPIQAWLMEGRLFISFPEELLGSISPAIYKGTEAFPLRKIEWSQEIVEKLQHHQSLHIFTSANQHNLSILSDLREAHVLDAGLNQFPNFSVMNGQTLHVRLATQDESIEIPLLVDLEVHCETDEIWSFEALLGCHRAQGSLAIMTTHQGKSKIQEISFDAAKAGGNDPATFQDIKLELNFEKGTTYLSLLIKHTCICYVTKDVFDCYYFIANPVLRYCGKTGQDQLGLQARALGQRLKPDTSTCLLLAHVSLFYSSEDPGLILNLGNGTAHELFCPGVAGVQLRTDYGHTLEVEAQPAGDYSLYINNTFCQIVFIGTHSTHIPLPVNWLRGEPILIEIRDPAGSQVYLRTSSVAPRFLTPREVLLHQVKPPLPTELSLRAHQRYQSLQRHCKHPIEGIQAEMVLLALETLEAGLQSREMAPLAFPIVSEPEVSIVIPAHNHVRVTHYCLCALLLAHNQTKFEIILIDDGSTDETSNIEKFVTGIRVIRNQKPLRFIAACNKAVKEARGKYVVLLNNDTEVTVGWLDELVDAFHRFENVGIVGSKLLNPDGSLQDAGGIVWGSGNPCNYGHGRNPWEPRFSYARQVDYLSGAALMTTTLIWNQVGGLSDYLEPMYFEDTDFSFKVRDAGYKTYIIPSSIVYHDEGTTAGKDPSQGFKMYQEVNRPKFKQRWAKAFARHGDEGDQPDLEKDRGIKGRILFIDYTTPREDQDAGSYAAMREIELIQSLGYKVTFVPQNLYCLGDYTDILMRNGVEVITAPFYPSLASFLSDRAKEFDAAYLTRYTVAVEAVPLIREHSPKIKILLNPADLHFLRQLRSALVNNDEQIMAAMRCTREHELDVMRRVDLVLSYNEVEHVVITSHTDGEVKVKACPWVVSVPESIAPLSQREGLSFLANFDFFPNAEGLKWFCREVMPLLASQGIRLTIYGSNLNDDIRDLASDWIVPVGYIKDVAAAYEKHRVFVAPLLSGAGVKGKVVHALAYGLPCVLTPIAAEGIGLRHGHDCLIVRNPEEWVSAILLLYRHDDRWIALSNAGREYATTQFSYREGQRKMREALEAVDLYNHMDS
jgi:GT2 family glycosyltransferase/glycosyltransferase involved in cell wall biosynthesis